MEKLKLKAFIGSYNLGGVKPYESVDLSGWICPFKEGFVPDIAVMGL